MSFPILIRKRWHYAPACCAECAAALPVKRQICEKCKEYHGHEKEFAEDNFRGARLILLAHKAAYFARRARWRKHGRYDHLMQKFWRYWELAAEAIARGESDETKGAAV